MNDSLESKMKAGTLVAIENGVYSDYGVMGFFRVAKDFDPRQAMDAYLIEFPDQAGQYSGDMYKFVNWLNVKGFLEDVDFMRWHIGEYDTFDPVSSPRDDDKFWKDQ